MESLKGTGVAIVTPFNEDKSVDFKGLVELTNHLIEGGVDYLVVQGTTGETPTLSSEEKREILACVLDTNQERLPIVLGIGGNDTASLVAEINSTDLRGVCAILSASPNYNKPTQNGIYEHFKALATTSPLPIILYNVPGRTASNVSSSTCIQLAKDFENIVAVKEASGDLNQIMEIAAKKPEEFLLISGDDALTFPMICCGGAGVISVVANAYPNKFSKMVSDSLNGNLVEARKSHFDMLRFTDLIFQEGNPAGVKIALQTLSVCKQFVRLPLVEASEELEKELKVEMRNLN